MKLSNASHSERMGLVTSDLTLSFGGHVVVDAVNAHYRPGTLTAIVGPNGAGKTTYFNLLSGQLRPTAGQIFLDGSSIESFSAARRARMGIGRAFQLTNLFPQLTVEENVRLAVQANAAGRHLHGLNFWSIWSDHAELLEKTLIVLRRVNLLSRRDFPVSSLPHGDQRKLEIAVLIAMDPAVYLLDEPTAGMNAAEAPVILDLIATLKAEGTKTILLVEHKLDVVRALADRVVVLHNGALVADGLPSEVIASPIVQAAYLGTPTQATS